MFVPEFARWPEFRSRLAAFPELLREAIRFLRTNATCGRPCAPGWLTIIKDARTPAWGLQFLKHPSRDLCHILNCTGTGCHLIVRSERRTFCIRQRLTVSTWVERSGRSINSPLQPNAGWRWLCSIQNPVLHSLGYARWLPIP